MNSIIPCPPWRWPSPLLVADLEVLCYFSPKSPLTLAISGHPKSAAYSKEQSNSRHTKLVSQTCVSPCLLWLWMHTLHTHTHKLVCKDISTIIWHHEKITYTLVSYKHIYCTSRWIISRRAFLSRKLCAISGSVIKIEMCVVPLKSSS